MNIVVLVPVWKRYSTLSLFAENMKDLGLPVVAVGSCPKDREECIKHGFTYVESINKPLGTKLNNGLKKVKELNPDAVLMLGSDDILSKKTLNVYKRELKKGVGFVGFLDCYFADLQTKRCIYWHGYKGERKGEPIGAWRVLTKETLDKLNWIAWGDQQGSIDHSMWQKLKGVTKSLLRCEQEGVVLMDLKTSENLTKFRLFPQSRYENLELTLKKGFSQEYINKILDV